MTRPRGSWEKENCTPVLTGCRQAWLGVMAGSSRWIVGNVDMRSTVPVGIGARVL
jgi:hypothetical protein